MLLVSREVKKSRGTTEKIPLSNENLKNHAIGLKSDKNLDIAFGSYLIFNMSEYEN